MCLAFSAVFLALSSALIVLSPCLPAMARPPGFRRGGGTYRDDAGYGRVTPRAQTGRRRPRRPGRAGAPAVRQGRGPGWPGALLRGSRPAPEQALGQAGPAQARIAAVPGDAVVARRAGGVGTGGVALAAQVVAVLADGGGLAAGLRQPAASVAAAAGGPAPRGPAAGSARAFRARRSRCRTGTASQWSRSRGSRTPRNGSPHGRYRRWPGRGPCGRSPRRPGDKPENDDHGAPNLFTL